MEEIELNLCKLLSDSNLLESEFYSPAFGKVTLSEVIPSELAVVIMDIASSVEYCLNPYGCLSSSPYGYCILFPSRALYEKYPLNAAMAWAEWQEARMPKRWRVKQNNEFYYFLDDMLFINNMIDSYDYFGNNRYKAGNYFRTKEEAEQAAEVVREALAKFHE